MKQGENVVGYTRVSTAEQATKGMSLVVQAAKIEQYASLYNLNLIGIESDEGESAKSLKRPGVRAALGRLKAGDAGGLVIYKLDRLTRSMRDWSALAEGYFVGPKRYALMSVCESIDTTTAVGRMALSIMILLGQWERETTVERTQAALDYRRGLNRRISNVIPYGWALGEGKQLVEVPAEQVQLARIRIMGANDTPHSAIAAQLERDGIPTRGGGPWGRSTIRGILGRRE